MKQPVRTIVKKIKKAETKAVTFSNNNEEGLDFCNECPFLGLSEDSATCNPNDRKLEFTDIKHIPVPQWCGNNKEHIKKLKENGK